MSAALPTVSIFNSLTGAEQALVPLTPGVVRMYVCGDTVYDFCHIGHARSKVAFDVVRRHLLWRGYRVIFVRNITDIDDKIIQRAAERGESIDTLTARYIDAMHTDYARLGLLPPDHEPRATEYVPGIVAMVQQLIARGHAYVAADGDVLYSVSSFADYGRLSGKKLADLRAGARVEIDADKRDPLDFVLWKRAKPGEPFWESPWGAGRPGWHIECSAMSTELLGPHFDIHGGGMDLKFPHHENEIAQSCAATGDKFANLWMHNGFVNVDNEKMSKSLGNFFTIREVLDSRDESGALRVRHPEVLRYLLTASHYRGPINYSLAMLDQADAALGRLYNALRSAPQDAVLAPGEATTRFAAAMDHDFNTPQALAVLQGLATDINLLRTAQDAGHAGALAAELRSLAAVLGLLQLPVEEWFRLRKAGDGATGAALGADEVERLIVARRDARAGKDFAGADRIRQQLTDAGVVLEDKPGGVTIWRYK
jgi:cysteinyl-tRNA synthetase